MVKTAKPEIHLIPEELTGPVIIHFGAPQGAPQIQEGQARLYEIPVDGQLYTSFPPNPGIRPDQSTQFYYVDGEGQRTPISSQTAQNLAPDTIVASNLYIFDQKLQYFIDRADRINTYENPAIAPDERKWQ